MAEFKGSDINEVLRLVKSLSPEGNTQLSILTIALVTACRSIGLSRDDVTPIILEAFNDKTPLTYLHQS